MELYTTLDNVIIHDNEKNESLWCNRIDGQLIPSHGKISDAELKIRENRACGGVMFDV